MTSPTKEPSDTAENDLKNSENEVPHECSTDIEHSFADSSIISHVENNPMNRELDTLTSQEHAILQAVEDNEFEVEKTQKDLQQEHLKEESLLIQIPIPRKLKSDKNNPLTNRTRLHSGKVGVKTSDFYNSTINYKIPLQLSILWRIPFINNHEIRRMILHLLCGRHFSQAASCQNTFLVKLKYIAFLPHPNVLTHGEKAIIFGRPLRVYYYHPLTERMTSGKLYKSTDAKGKDGFHIFVRTVFYIPQSQIENTLNRKAFEDHLRSHDNMRVVIISTDDVWKY
ncbi:CPX chromosomal region candidate gene 1 protein [Ursus maritimus]|uniref:CPX chromosomal region candidate gene 1 protein n=1 Tax=Ursus maritimus TaxID=29073 RepID=A0A384CVP0_URSMA|nr:CPX chromosomal region candidate gene 1 protein [Ursus maritimus]XP_026335884.1 CPX chromosomal region candidate gene 1 protein [Ursus arctos]